MLFRSDVPDPREVGAFRGEAGLEACRVQVAGSEAVPSGEVIEALGGFERTLRRVIEVLDEAYPAGTDLDIDGLAAAIDLAAWAHAEWVRIHPLANGNGRIARIWANAVLMRYGLPPVVRLRPRPDSGYGRAAAAAMRGNWRPTALAIRRMLVDGG